MNKPLFKSHRPQVQTCDLRPKNGLHRIDELVAILIRKYELLAALKREPAESRARDRNSPSWTATDETSKKELPMGKLDPVESLRGESAVGPAGLDLQVESTRNAFLSTHVSTAETKPELKTDVRVVAPKCGASPPTFPVNSVQATFEWYQSVEAMS